MSIHAADKGRPVRALATSKRCYPPDFPGWGTPDAASHLKPIAEGVAGIISNVESHGSSPYTRYCVRFSDGSHAAGLVIGADIEFADGNPAQHTAGCS